MEQETNQQVEKQMKIIYIVGAVAILVFAVGAWAFNHGVVSLGAGGLSFSLDGASQPSLDRKVNFPPEFSAEAQQIYTERLDAVKAAINSNPSDLEVWFDLAILYRQVNDQKGAVEIWKWIAANYPTEAVSRHNLGEHYFHNEKDYAAAEKWYRDSIEQAPGMAINYTDMYEMYTYVYKQETNAAEDIINEGMEKVSKREKIDFQLLLATRFQENGDTTKALTYFQGALAGAKELKLAPLVTDITKKIANLQK